MDVIVNATKDEAPIGSKPLSGQGSYYQNILINLGYNPLNPPLADLLKAYHHLEGQWLIASPIYWQATHNDAMLTEVLDLSEEESRLWFAEVVKFLKTDGFDPVYHDAQTWLFKIDNKPAISSKSVYSMLHESLMPILNALDKTLFWQRLITELQMYLSAHPLNTQRGDKLPVNGLWFWGEGPFQLSQNRLIVTDDPVLLNVSPKISPLKPTTVFTKKQLLIIKNPQQLELGQLEKKTQKNTVHWYWNNLAYTQTNYWWSRLWR